MLTSEIARERVTKGAAHLDRVVPGWFHRVDIGTLTLSSCEDCVLGQLAGPRAADPAYFEHCFTRGLKLARLYEDVGNALAALHGFALLHGDVHREYSDPSYSSESDVAFALLQDAWIAAIAQRRHPVTEAPAEQCAEVLV